MKKALCGMFLALLPMGAEGPAEEMDRLMSAYAKLDRFSGTVLVARKGRIVYQAAFGAADAEHGVRNTLQTAFPIGSITKQFTAAAVMKLVQQGKLDLHQPIRAYLPDYPRPSGDVLTVHHLLNHTSGIPSLFQRDQGTDEVTLEHAAKPIAMPELLATFQNKPLRFQPGSMAAYSNSGYTVLAHLIDRVAGVPWEEFVRDQILRPAGMRRTCAGECPPQAKLSCGFDDARKPAPLTDASWGRGSGSILSTVEDLYRWDRSLAETTVLSADTIRLMTTPSGNKWYGYGWFLGERDGRKVVEHSGTGPGAIAMFYRIPEDQVMVALLTNHTHDGDDFPLSADLVRRIAGQLVDRLYGKTAELPPVEGSATPAAAMEGQYRFGNGDVVRIVRGGGGLVARVAGATPWAFYSTPASGINTQLPVYQAAAALAEAYRRGDFAAVPALLKGPESRHPPAAVFESIWKDDTRSYGALQGYRVHQAAGQRAKVAMFFEKRCTDLVVTVAPAGGVDGFFWASPLPTELRLRPLAGPARGAFFVDGYRLGLPDLFFRFALGKLVVDGDGSAEGARL